MWRPILGWRMCRADTSPIAPSPRRAPMRCHGRQRNDYGRCPNGSSPRCRDETGSALIDRTFGPDTDATDGDDQFSVPVAKLRDAIGEQQLAGAFAHALPTVARPRFGGE